MDFIQAFVQAKELGLSKEEFVSIWETEAKTKLKADEAKILQLHQNNVPVNTNHQNDSTPETLLHHQTVKTDKLINEFSKLNKRFDTLISNLEQEARQNYEFRQQFKSLSDRLEVWMAASEVYVTERGSEGRGKVIENLKREGRSKLRPLAPSFEMANGDNLQPLNSKIQSVASSFEIVNGDVPQNKGQNGAVISNEHRDLNLHDECLSVWDLDDYPWKSEEQNNSNVAVSIAAANSKQLHFQGTGKFADAISSMMIHDEIAHGQSSGQDDGKTVPSYLTESNEQSEFQEILRNNGKKKQDAIRTDPAITLIPQKGAEFYIPNFKVFQSRGNDFFTETLYTRPKACRVRLRLWFNKRGGRLGVHLLVSQGLFDDRYKWPMIFQGNGYIFNQGSQTYTKLWEIEPQPCHRPETNQEVTLGASVCLETSRGRCEDVTADLLMKKRYVSDGDRLLFRWSIKADDIKPDQQAAGLYFPQSPYPY